MVVISSGSLFFPCYKFLLPNSSHFLLLFLVLSFLTFSTVVLNIAICAAYFTDRSWIHTSTGLTTASNILILLLKKRYFFHSIYSSKRSHPFGYSNSSLFAQKAGFVLKFPSWVFYPISFISLVFRFQFCLPLILLSSTWNKIKKP